MITKDRVPSGTRSSYSHHFFLLHFLVDNVPRSELRYHVVERYPHLDGKHRQVIDQIGDLIDRLFFVAALARDDDLSRLFDDFFEYFVDPFFK